jgi:hypothetical protein
LGYTVNRGAQVELKWERVQAPADDPPLQLAVHLRRPAHDVPGELREYLGVEAQVEFESKV